MWPVMRSILLDGAGSGPVSASNRYRAGWPSGKIATMAQSSPRVLITTDDFNLADEVAALRANDKRVGAVCTFTGTVRDRNMAPTLGTGVPSLPSEGAELARGGPSLRSSADAG